MKVLKRSDSMLKMLVIIAVLIFLISTGVESSFADVPRIEIPSSINPVGSGARALGMGGAFIAVADDATAASWNPGGLIQLETPEVSIVGSYFIREEDISFGERPEASGTQDVRKGDINYLSAVYPFNVFNRNMVLSINYQNLYDFSRDWRSLELLNISEISETEAVIDISDFDLVQSGALSAIGIAYCVQATPRLSLGLTFNIWSDDLSTNGWKNSRTFDSTVAIADVSFPYTAKQNDKYSLSGYNANLGFLWNLSSRVTVGAVLKTPFTADLDHKYNENVNYEDGGGFSNSENTEEKLYMPMSYGMGLSYRCSDRLTVAIDINRTEWDDYILKDADGNKTSPVNNKPTDEADIDPTTQLRTGFEYLFIGNTYVVPVRGGFFYDPAPAEGSPDDFYGFSLGSGIARGKVVFDIAYQYRFGNDVAKYIFDNLDFSQDMREHTLYVSFIYHL